MKISKKILSMIFTITCILGICKTDFYYYNINAASNLVIDYSNVEKNPYNQFYYSDEDEFFIDGISVYYNNEDVTSKTQFTFFTTPATTYDGKNLDYVVPFIADYENLSTEGQVDVKIGLRGDANCDHQITLSDLVLVENEMLQSFCAGKSALTLNDEFGIFLANVDGVQKKESQKPFGANDLNIADAFFINSYLNNKSKSLYDNMLLKYALKPNNGEISISSAGCKSGSIATIYLSQKCNNALGAFDFSCKWDDNDLELVNVCSVDDDATVFYALTDDKLNIWGFGKNNALNDGDFIVLQFKVPKNAPVNKTYNIAIYEINYFGSGINISDDVMTYNGKIKVTSKGTDNSSASTIDKIDPTSYNYEVKVWDVPVKYGTTSVSVPVILLGGLQTKGMEMTIQCDSPLRLESLPNALSLSQSSNTYVGIYESDNPLGVDFETLNINIDANAKPGRYPINITIKDIDPIYDNSTITVYNGSIIIKDKSVVHGDANEDGKMNIRDAAYIASSMVKGNAKKLPLYSDFNSDGNINIRDAAAISKNLVT